MRYDRETSAGSIKVRMWAAGGADDNSYSRLRTLQTELENGGMPITPYNMTLACHAPPIGEDLYYVVVNIDGKSAGYCEHCNSEFCRETIGFRKRQLGALIEDTQRVMYPQYWKQKFALDEANQCMVDACGPCVGAGRVWKEKVQSCAKMVDHLASWISFKEPLGNASFYNYYTTEKSLHDDACDDTKYNCLHNTQLFSLVATIVAEEYEPYSGSSIRERIYGATDNPLPILDLVEQRMAMAATGEAHVFIGRDLDLVALRNVAKVLMVKNDKVARVKFHVSKSMDDDQVYGRIQDWIDIWKGEACPYRGRSLVAPYDVLMYEPSPSSMTDDAIENNGPNWLRWDEEWLSKV